MKTLRHLACALLAFIACTNEPAPSHAETPSRGAIVSNRSSAEDVRITAASLFTLRYSRSRLSGWNVRASAAGPQCSVLLVQTAVVMEDSMIEAMHYGAGAYDIYDGGVQRFYRERTFRGVAYKDASGRVWTYGAVSESEAETLAPCQ